MGQQPPLLVSFHQPPSVWCLPPPFARCYLYLHSPRTTSPPSHLSTTKPTLKVTGHSTLWKFWWSIGSTWHLSFTLAVPQQSGKRKNLARTFLIPWLFRSQGSKYDREEDCSSATLLSFQRNRTRVLMVEIV